MRENENRVDSGEKTGIEVDILRLHLSHRSVVSTYAWEPSVGLLFGRQMELKEDDKK